MKKNLLFLLFAVLTGLMTAQAQVVDINVDKAANVVVTTGGGEIVKLVNGNNRITTLTSADNPLTIAAAAGATIESLTVDNVTKYPSGDGIYRLGIYDMTVDITTSGEGETPAEEVLYDVTVSIPNFAGTATLSYDDVTIVPEQNYNYNVKLPARPVTVSASEGYQISSVNYDPWWTGNMAVNNGDGTWSFTPLDYNGSMVTINIIEKGIMFNVDVNLASNVSVYAFMDSSCEWDNTRGIELLGYKAPYTGVAPVDLYALGFGAPEGGEIRGITRVRPNGDKDQLVHSDWKGWVSYVEDGDTFIIDAVGPEVEMSVSSETEGIAVTQYVVSVDGDPAEFTAENPVVKAHAGSLITVGGTRGIALRTIYQDCGELINGEGPVASFKIVKAGSLAIYGSKVTDITIDIDNASAVVIKDRNGYGEELTLQDGSNVMANVSNPLNITAAAGFQIVSVVLDGEVLKANADGSYTAAIEEGSTLVITTAVKPAAYPVTIVLEGEFEWLNVANEGDALNLTAENSTVAVEPGNRLTFSPVKGYLINSLTTSASTLFAEYDEDDDVWTVTVNGPGSIVIDMEKWVAGEDNILIDYSVDRSFNVAATVLDPEGEWVSKLNIGLNEIAKGNKIRLYAIGDVYFDKVLYNGEEVAFENNKEVVFTVEEEGSVDVITTEDEYIEITGYNTSDPVNHAIIGYVYVNKEGEAHYRAQAGETVTLIPVPGPGYKFAGFEWASPAYVLDMISSEPPYTFTVPADVEYVMVRASFVKDEERPGYVVHAYQCYVGGYDISDISSEAFVRLRLPGASMDEITNDMLLAEGDQVELLCFVADETMQCEHFCLYTSPTTVLPQIYTVNGADANIEGVIEVSAYVVRNGQGAVDEVAENGFRYDASAATLHSPAAGVLYTIGGQAVKNVEEGANDLSGLAAGIYVAVTPEGTFKLAK